MEKDFVHLTYTDAVDLLAKTKKKFEFPVILECSLNESPFTWLCFLYFESLVFWEYFGCFYSV